MLTTGTLATARAFCSTANLGAGFDVFGLALNRFSDTVGIRITQGKRLRIFVKGSQLGYIPREVAKNSAGPPARALLREAGLKKGLEITVTKGVPQGLGLGSSGATAAASAKAVDHLLGLDLSNDELVRAASLGEKAVSGTAHADNVGASLLGGFVITYDNPVRTIMIKPPKTLVAVVVTPQHESRANKTRKARKLVPVKVRVQSAVMNVGRASAIAAGFALGDISMVGAGMMDEIAEPYRRDLIPGYEDVKRNGLNAGAAGVSISGAGPSMISLVDRSRQTPEKIAGAMVRGFSQHNVESSWFVARPAPGTRIIEG